MTTIRTISLSCSHDGEHSSLDIPAVVTGNWAAHGVIDGLYMPRTDAWTVTYVPSGLCLSARVGTLTPAQAVAISIALDGAVHDLPDLSTETGQRVADVIAQARRAA